MAKQHRDSQAGGPQLVGKAPSAPRRAPAKFMGKAGTGDNQSTSRGKGTN